MKIEKEFKVFGDIEYLQTLLYDNGFRNPYDVLHSNMHFSFNGKTVKLRIEYDVNRTGFGLRFFKITKEDINSKDPIKPKTENETKLTPAQFIEEFKKYSKKVKSKNIVFYTLVKERFSSTDKRYKNITVDVCEFAKWPVDINRFGLADMLTKYPDLVPFINKLNKSSARLTLAQPYIEIESLSKNMTTSKLVEIVTKELFEDEDIFITNKSAATLTKIFHGQYNALRVKSDTKSDKKETKENKESKKSDETVSKKIIDSDDKYADVSALQNIDVIAEHNNTLSKALVNAEDNEITSFLQGSSNENVKNKESVDNIPELKKLFNEKYGVNNADVFKDRGVTLPTDFDGECINIIHPSQGKNDSGYIINCTVEKSRGNFNKACDTDNPQPLTDKGLSKPPITANCLYSGMYPALKLKKVARGNNRYVRVENSGQIYTFDTRGNYLSWLREESNTTVDLEGVCYGDGYFIAVGKDTILISVVPGSWHPINIALDPSEIDYIDGAFVIIGKDGNKTILKTI